MVPAIFALMVFVAWLTLPAPAAAQGPIGSFSTNYGSTVTTLSTTSGTVLTTNTTLVQILYCDNTTGSAATVTIKDHTLAKEVVSAFSIAANSNVRFIDSPVGMVLQGIEWWQGTASAINCYAGGRQ